ncbi:MAG: hypothetical protein JWQ07_4654 [Ramlibacter sp.]|nr:hypothetical protein [Ramlibacter sp.]
MPKLNRRHLLAAVTAFAAMPARAQSFKPTRPVRLINPALAGGAGDAILRLIALKLSELWGQAVVVDSRPGGGMIAGTQAVAQAPADGYTLGGAYSPFTINPSLRADLPYDTLKDLTPITQIGAVTGAVVAHPSLPANNLKELIELARAAPGSLSWGSPGLGTSGHITGELMARRAGISVTHVPFAGGPGIYRELLPGRLQYAFVLLESAQPHLAAGKLKLLAITDRRRHKLFPQTQVLDETIRGLSFENVFGLIGPGGMPADILASLHADIVKVLQDPEMRQQLERQAVEPVASSPAEYAAFVRRDIEHWKLAVKESGARVN